MILHTCFRDFVDVIVDVFLLTESVSFFMNGRVCAMNV